MYSFINNTRYLGIIILSEFLKTRKITHDRFDVKKVSHVNVYTSLENTINVMIQKL